MRIDASGNVGIATTSPSTYGKLAVVGDGYFSGNMGIGATPGLSKLDVTVTSATVYSSGALGNGLRLYNNSPTTGQYVGISFYGEPSTGSNGGATIMGTTTGSGSMDLVFSTRGGSTYAERMRILNTGNILSLAGGSTTATGTGIAFPATQSASANANTLDDYEEGTWTPTEAAVTVSTSVGHYTKIGNKVTAWAYMVWPTTADANNVVINGLPFTIANAEDNRSCFVSSCNAALLLSGTGSIQGIPNSTQSQLFKADGNRATNANMSTAALRATWIYYV
jgi:hypothetical protein